MINLPRFLIILCSLPLALQAATLKVADLGELDLRYSQVQAIANYTGPSMAAHVESEEGQAYQLFSPFMVQQLAYQVENGAWVEQGQTVLRMTGSEVHHFIERIEAAQSILSLAKHRYDNNQSLYRQQAISESTWQDIVSQYQQARLAFGHLGHFQELIAAVSESGDSIVLKAPSAGFIRYSTENERSGSEPLLARFIDRQALRVSVNIPVVNASTLSHLSTPECNLQIEHLGQSANGLFVKAWSEAVPQGCKLLPGQQLSIKPGYTTQAYLVPRQSVFRFEQRQQVMLHDGQQLISQPVQIVASQGKHYVITSDTSLSQYEVLASSVGAVKGLLLGMGGE
ncbi:hypothetical protein [Lacimicrobium alkaliphilum]|uniref:RND efflux pump membrane fusion protein barrel-sandwich domain-containing protein n=1 Tax=Lacimicrobium alkaliphilum TaxID=1526571 RepID=A0ABQ1RDR0_9ALTE|nr:hypothetical protein [Lacimicrobium alkaliphilum]GGD63737.1 hypothetical protein GCM10011357_18830 [Lacimicrobium alkaliphilum]